MIKLVIKYLWFFTVQLVETFFSQQAKVTKVSKVFKTSTETSNEKAKKKSFRIIPYFSYFCKC